MDFDALLRLLTLAEKLLGHPQLSATKSLVDAELLKLNDAHKAEADKVVAAKKAKDVADAAKAAHEAQVLAAAADARKRLADAEAAKAAPQVDAKTVAEADAIEKARLHREEELRKQQGLGPAPAVSTADRSDGMPSPSFVMPKKV